MLKKFINHIKLILTKSTNSYIELKCFRSSPDAIIPNKAHVGLFEDAAFDLFATEDILLQPNQRLMVDTKLSFIVPDGFWIKLRERSGLANKGIHILGGVLDSGYTGNVKVIMYNSDKEPLTIPYGKGIAQFTVEKLTKTSIKEITFNAFNVEAQQRERGCKGFGSSDVKSNNSR